MGNLQNIDLNKFVKEADKVISTSEKKGKNGFLSIAKSPMTQGIVKNLPPKVKIGILLALAFMVTGIAFTGYYFLQLMSNTFGLLNFFMGALGILLLWNAIVFLRNKLKIKK